MAESVARPGAGAEWTCGMGLAEHAAVPAKISELLRALSANLDAHVPTIDIRDASGRDERDAYVHLAADYASLAAQLEGTAERMLGYRDLPPALHHEQALSATEIADAFAAYVALEHELGDMLRDAAARHGELLRQMQSTRE